MKTYLDHSPDVLKENIHTVKVLESTSGHYDLFKEADEREYLDEIIPLDIKKEIFERNEISFLKSRYIGLIDEGLDFRELFREIKNLTFPEFQEIFKKEGSFTCLINESIWENTLHYVIDESFCNEIIARVKNENNGYADLFDSMA